MNHEPLASSRGCITQNLFCFADDDNSTISQDGSFGEQKKHKPKRGTLILDTSGVTMSGTRGVPLSKTLAPFAPPPFVVTLHSP